VKRKQVNSQAPLLHATPFVAAEIAELQAICAKPGFIEECARCRRWFFEDSRNLSVRPSERKAKYRAWRRWFEPGARGPRQTPPNLTVLDAAELALIDPTFRAWTEPRPSQRAATAFGALERRIQPTRYSDRPARFAAWQLRLVFSEYGLPFTDYDGDKLGRHGLASRALRVVLPLPPRNMRNLIQAAKKMPTVLDFVPPTYPFDRNPR